MKTCNKCKQEKPLSEFDPDKRAADGISTTCRGCKASAPETKIRVPQVVKLKKPGGMEDLLLTLIVSLIKRINKIGISNNDIKSICILSKEYRENKSISDIADKAEKQYDMVKLILDNKKVPDHLLAEVVEELTNRGILQKEENTK